MEGVITKTLVDFKKAVMHAKKFGITWVESNGIMESNWLTYRDDTVLVVEEPFLYFTSIKKLSDEISPITISNFLKTEYVKDNPKGKNKNKR